MSAWKCSAKHTSIIALWGLYTWNSDHPSPGDMLPGDVTRLSDKLQRANNASLRARYRGSRKRSVERYPGLSTDVLAGWARLSPAYVLKQCDCYDYQACEYKGYGRSEAAQIVNRARQRAIEILMRGSAEYESAPWGA